MKLSPARAGLFRLCRQAKAVDVWKRQGRPYGSPLQTCSSLSPSELAVHIPAVAVVR